MSSSSTMPSTSDAKSGNASRIFLDDLLDAVAVRRHTGRGVVVDVVLGEQFVSGRQPPFGEQLLVHLRDLERSGLVHRHVFDETPIHVEYTLTGLGRSLLTVVQQLCDWAVVNMPQVETAQVSFETRTQPATPLVRTTA
jgi:hypothetical protein